LTAHGRPPGSPAWRVERQRGPAADLLGPTAGLGGDDEPASRRVRILEVDRPAIVLGSSQPNTDVDADAAADAGVDVVRRRSGGAAVYLAPGELVWVDVIIPATDPLWDADVGRATWWIGEAWAAAIDGATAGPAEVWRTAMRRSAWSGRVCFAGIGPGEVCVDGRKVVGVSQRRVRGGALFQTAALLRWEPGAVLDLLRYAAGERARGRGELAPMAAGVGPERAEALVDGLLSALPSP
jgi:lipoate-protein ligase A